jgi:GGDEF domain-containing protein
MLTRMQAIGFTIAIICFVIGIGVFTQYLPNYSGLTLLKNERFAKTLWLALALGLHLTFGMIFVQIISKLTIRLESSIDVDRKTGLYDEENTIAFAEKLLLKLRGSESAKQLMSFMIVELKGISEQSEIANQDIVNRMAIILQRHIGDNSSMIGSLANNQIAICVEVDSPSTAKAMAQKFLDTSSVKLNNSTNYKGCNIGLITVGGNIDVDVASLRLLAARALSRAKDLGNNNYLDYSDMKNV